MNDEIINNFKKLVELIKIEYRLATNKKDKLINLFRIKNTKKVINIISKLNFKIKSSEQLKNIGGIGKNSLQRIDEIIKTGKLKELKDYKKIISKYLNEYKIIDELSKVIGIGEQMAKQLVSKYKIKSIDDLKEKILKNHIDVNEKIKLGLKYVGKFEGKIPRKEIDSLYIYLDELTNNFNKNMFITICGSYRRGLNYSSDIDILLSDFNLIMMDDIINSDDNLLNKYVSYLHLNKFLIDDITDKNYITKYMGFCKFLNKTRRIDIRLIPLESYWTALMYFTGSAQFNEDIRKTAKAKGYKLNEYEMVNLKSGNKELILSEQDIFNTLGKKYIELSNR